MKKSLILVFTILLLAGLVATPAAAADFSIFGSYYETDDYDEAAGFGARVGLFEVIQLEIGASWYDTFGRDLDFDLDDGIDPEDVTLELDVIPVDVGVRFNFGPRGLYVAGGGTYFILDSDTGSTDDEFGFYARVGLQFSGLFVEAGYRDVDGTVDSLDLDNLDDVEFDDDVLAYDLTGFFVNLGWRF